MIACNFISSLISQISNSHKNLGWDGTSRAAINTTAVNKSNMGGLSIDFGLINADNVEQVSFGVTFICAIPYVHFFIMCHFLLSPPLTHNTYLLHLIYV